MGSRISQRRTAQERWKSTSRPAAAIAIAVSSAVHFAIFSGAEFDIEYRTQSGPFQPINEIVLRAPDRVSLLPPPPSITRPAIPVVAASLTVDAPEITIPEINFAPPPVEIPPPPTLEAVDISREPVFTPHEVRPRLRNEPEFRRDLSKRYPVRLQRAGITGRTILWIFIDENGEVRNTRVVESSGYDDLDEAAIAAVLETAEFTPAMNRDRRVPVWVQLPISFVLSG